LLTDGKRCWDNCKYYIGRYSDSVTHSRINTDVLSHCMQYCCLDIVLVSCQLNWVLISVFCHVSLLVWVGRMYVSQTNYTLWNLSSAAVIWVISVVKMLSYSGHTRLTHSYLLNRQDQPQCLNCDCTLTVEHVLLECNH